MQVARSCVAADEKVDFLRDGARENYQPENFKWLSENESLNPQHFRRTCISEPVQRRERNCVRSGNGGAFGSAGSDL